MALPHNQRQMFLKEVQSSNPDRDALGLFDHIIQYFELSQATENVFKPVTLIRLMKEEVSDKEVFVNLFFPLIENHPNGTPLDKEPTLLRILDRLNSFATWATEDQSVLDEGLAVFARFLIDNCFLPYRLL